MAYSTQRAVSTGSLVSLDLSIQYLSRNDITVFYNSIPAGTGTWAWVGTTDKRITFSPAIANGVEVLVKRSTRLDQQINVFASGAKFNNATMDINFTQVIYLNQEAVEGGQLSDVYGTLNLHGNKVINLGPATADTDAVSYGQYKAESQGAYQAAIAAGASASSATASATSAQAWASQLTTTVDGTSYSAKQYALNASISASAALGSQNAAAASASSASGSAATATTQAGIATTKAAEAAASDTHATAIAADVLNIQQNASDALTAANAAVTTANGVDAKATTALNNSNTANTNASAAVSTANAASSAVAGKMSRTGVTNGSASAAGIIGELFRTNVTSGGIAATAVTSIITRALTAGDWEIEGTCSFSCTAATNDFTLGIGTAVNTFGGIGSYNAMPFNTANCTISTPKYIINLSGPASVYLVARCGLAAVVTGTMTCRRVAHD